MNKLIERMIGMLLLSLLTITIVLTLSAPIYATGASDWKVVPASEWKLVAESGNLKYYVDKKSIKEYVLNCSSCACCACFLWYMSEDFDYPPDRYIRAWIKKISKIPKQYGAKEELDYQEDDCTKSRSRLLHLTKFYPDGINESFNLSAVIEWDSIPPHSAAEFIHKYLCKNR